MSSLKNIIKDITPSDYEVMRECLTIWDGMGKPIGSLGQMENLHIKSAGIRGVCNPSFNKRILVVMCADNGIVEEGVTQTGSEVSAIVAENFFDYKTATSIMCKKYNCDMDIVDVGLFSDTVRTKRCKINYGSNNFTKQRAISKEDVIAVIEKGIDIAIDIKNKNYDCILAGEMGIGNTTTSSAVCSALLGLDPSIVTGRGAGLSDDGLNRKIDAINRGLKLHFGDKKRSTYVGADEVIDVLSAVGGYDICAMAGLYIGAAYVKLPIILDGFISAVAALCACKIKGEVRDYLLPSHMSAEPASKMIFEYLELNPCIRADFRLGEGSGAVMLLPFLDMAEELFSKMGSFDDIGVTPYEKFN